MRNVCESCKYAKKKGGTVNCVKYGIAIYSERMYCISWERDTEGDKVQEQKDRGRWSAV